MVMVLSPVEKRPVSKDTPFTAPGEKLPIAASLVRLCRIPSKFRTVMVAPGGTVTFSGLKLRLWMVMTNALVGAVAGVVAPPPLWVLPVADPPRGGLLLLLIVPPHAPRSANATASAPFHCRIIASVRGRMAPFHDQ